MGLLFHIMPGLFLHCICSGKLLPQTFRRLCKYSPQPVSHKFKSFKRCQLCFTMSTLYTGLCMHCGVNSSSVHQVAQYIKFEMPVLQSFVTKLKEEEDREVQKLRRRYSLIHYLVMWVFLKRQALVCASSCKMQQCLANTTYPYYY